MLQRSMALDQEADVHGEHTCMYTLNALQVALDKTHKCKFGHTLFWDPNLAINKPLTMTFASINSL